MRIGPLPQQAQPVGQLRHTASRCQPAFHSLSARLPQAADRVVGEPEYVSRHARLLGLHRRRLDEKHFDRYARWAPRHNSWLIVTFDENAGGKVKPIFTIIVGAKVRPGVYAERLSHYKLLRTIEESYRLPPLGHAKGVRPLSTLWTS